MTKKSDDRYFTKRIMVEVPPTMEMGSYKTFVTINNFKTFRQEALQDYNSARSHDGLPPIKKMPRKTRYYREWLGKESDGSENAIYLPMR